MFFESVRTALITGQVKIGLSPIGHGDQVSVEACGLIGLKAKFLTSTDKQKLVEVLRGQNNDKTMDLSVDTLRYWVEAGRVVLITGPGRSGKTSLVEAALPKGLIVNGRTTDLSRPNWFWHGLTKDQSQYIVIDEPGAFSQAVLEELLKVVRNKGLGYVVVTQEEDGSGFEILRRHMTSQDSPEGKGRFIHLRISSFDGLTAIAKWQTPT